MYKANIWQSNNLFQTKCVAKTLDFCPHSLPSRLSFAFRNASSLKLFDNVEIQRSSSPRCQRSDIEIKSFPFKKIVVENSNERWKKKVSGAAPPHYYLACFLHHACYCCCRRILCTLVSTLLRDDNYEWHLQVPCWLYYIWVLDCYFLIWQ